MPRQGSTIVTCKRAVVSGVPLGSPSGPTARRRSGVPRATGARRIAVALGTATNGWEGATRVAEAGQDRQAGYWQRCIMGGSGRAARTGHATAVPTKLHPAIYLGT
eukprot:363836-Chlamydomonas_euryale.AAC.10